MGGTHAKGNQKVSLDEIGAAFGRIVTNVESDAKQVYDLYRSGKLPEALLEGDRKLHPKDRSVSSFSVYIDEGLGIQKELDKWLDKKQKGTGEVMGLFVPPSVKATDKVNVILYLHGDKVRIVAANATIKDYWNLAAFPLREGLKESGQPYVLAAPTLGQNSDMEFGNLGEKIDDHLDNIMLQLFRYGPPDFAPPKPPQVGDVILAGHSGAFGGMGSILTNMKRYKSNVKEIWGFDVMYGALYMQLASATIPVFVYFNGTAAKSRKLAAMKNPNVFVMEGSDFFMKKGKEHSRMIEHDLLVQRFWLDRLRRIGSKGLNPDDQKRMVSG